MLTLEVRCIGNGCCTHGNCGGTETSYYCSVLKAYTYTVNILLNTFKLSITTYREYLRDNGYEVMSTYLKFPNIYRVFYMSRVVK